MTDIPIRKTLSLKRKKSAATNPLESQTKAEQQTLAQNTPSEHGLQKPKWNYQEQEVSFSTLQDSKHRTTDHVSLLANHDKVLAGLQQKREAFLKKIEVLEQRLVFISSEPLKIACNELKKQDTEILCQINNYLINRLERK